MTNANVYNKNYKNEKPNVFEKGQLLILCTLIKVLYFVIEN